MITKAIVEEVVDKYSIRVRIPILDRTASSSIHTKAEDLNVATVCTLPNCDVNLQPGDIVFVAVDETLEENVVILGHLYREKVSDTFCDFVLNELRVNQKTELSSDTYIGEVLPEEIQKLVGVRSNIQKQLDSLQEQINTIVNQSTNKFVLSSEENNS